MPREVTRLDLDEAAIASLTASPAGMVSRWTGRVARETKTLAAQTTRASTGSRWAPHNAGPRMWQLYSDEVVARTARKVTFKVKNSAPHAVFVLLGTTGPIYPRRAGKLAVGRSQYGGVGRLPKGADIIPARSVDGQTGRNFLFDALVATLESRGV